MNEDYTIIIRKTEDTYIGLCMELNICTTGETLKDVNHNLKDAINVYLNDIRAHPETIVEPISIADFIEFLRDTEQDSQNRISNSNLRSYQINSLPVYA